MMSKEWYVLTIPPFDPDFDENIFVVASLIAAYTNAHMHFDLMNLDDAEREVGIMLWKDVMQDMIEEKG